jgi:tetratricopeptide (TPR) repeat protein
VSRSTLNKLLPNSHRQPQDPEAWYARGVAALDRGELEEGRQDLLQSTQMGPPVLERLLSVAHRLTAVGFGSDAAMVLRRAIESFAERAEPKVALAWLYLEAGDARQAAQTAVFALRTHARDPELHIVAAAAHEQLGAGTEAANHLVAVLAVDADHLEANRRLAMLLGRMGDEAGAERCLRRIVEVTDGQDLEAAVSLSIALSRSGRHPEAIGLLSDVARRSPDASAIRADLGMALLASGDLDGGIAAFSAALAIDPRSAQAYCGLGLAYRQLERYQEAADAFRASEQLAPEQATASFNLGLVLAVAGDEHGARKAMLRAAALDPDDAEIQQALQSILAPPAAELSGPSRAADKKTEFSASISGDLTSFTLPDVLEFLRLQSKTGSLMVASRQGAGIVRLIRGQVTSASAPGVQRLGEALVERGIITPEGLKAALARQKGAGGDSSENLGTVLFKDGPPGARAELRGVVFQQVLDALAEMLNWNEGAFSFHPEPDKDLPAISFDVQNVMLELMRLTDERNQDRASHPKENA